MILYQVGKRMSFAKNSTAILLALSSLLGSDVHAISKHDVKFLGGLSYVCGPVVAGLFKVHVGMPIHAVGYALWRMSDSQARKLMPLECGMVALEGAASCAGALASNIALRAIARYTSNISGSVSMLGIHTLGQISANAAALALVRKMTYARCSGTQDKIPGCGYCFESWVQVFQAPTRMYVQSCALGACADLAENTELQYFLAFLPGLFSMAYPDWFSPFHDNKSLSLN